MPSTAWKRFSNGRGWKNEGEEDQAGELADEAIETIDPDTWQLMKRLEKMGVIQFNAESLQDVVVRTMPRGVGMNRTKIDETAGDLFEEHEPEPLQEELELRERS